MTTITLPRATVEQALHVAENAGYPLALIKALRAALAQQAEPVAPVEPVACCDLEERKALSSVKLPCDVRIGHGTHRKGSSLLALVVRSRSLYQMVKSDDYYGYASRLAVAIWEKHYKDAAPQWKPLDDMMGVLTQIDNMTSGLTRLAKQAEPAQEPDYWQEEARRYAGNADYWRKRYEALAEPVDTDCHTQGICQRSGYGIGRQAEPVEPVAWLTPGQDLRLNNGEGFRFSDWTPLYTAPPQRKPLTDEKISDLWCGVSNTDFVTADTHVFARAIERAHGIKE